jgi:hypothetical protein
MLNRLLTVLRLRKPAPHPLAGCWVRVHVADAPSVEGAYLYERAGYLFVETPKVLPERGDDRERPLAGELAIPLRRVVYVQRMPS